jgi:chemotaxis-related protein WspB
MLFLLVRPGSDTYAIETGAVRRILPFARLKNLPSSLPAIAGVLNFHGRAVPVLDLTLLLTGAASRERLGTRIILADIALGSSSARPLGLLAEGAHSVARFAAEDFQPAGANPRDRAWLGPVAEHAGQLVQRIEIARLLPADVLDALTNDSAVALVP